MMWVSEVFDTAQQWLFESVLQPLMFSIGLGNLLENGYAATGWLLAGLVQIVLIVAVIGPLQHLRPVDPITDRTTIATDMVYTLVHRLGLFRLCLFFTLDPVTDAAIGWLRVAGLSPWHLDGFWPGVTDMPWVSLVLYLVVLDGLDYWIHRGQHQFEWWWRLHSLHHAQRQMTMWSDNRNHLLDDMLRDTLLVAIAQLIGVAPGQFIAILAITQLSESLQHANLRMGFGRLGERLWISPRFHRRHHSIGIGHESLRPLAPSFAAGSVHHAMKNHADKTSIGYPAGMRVVRGGHNYGVLLPCWDMLFGTANFEDRYDPTGVRDQVEPGPNGQVRDYGQGFWGQQWRGVLRLLGRA